SCNNSCSVTSIPFLGQRAPASRAPPRTASAARARGGAPTVVRAQTVRTGGFARVTQLLRPCFAHGVTPPRVLDSRHQPREARRRAHGSAPRPHATHAKPG